MSARNDKLEQEFEAFLAEERSRLASLYRKLPQVEPDARLDASVRAMAHRALNPQLVATSRADTARRQRLRWVPALGAAAGVVLAAGIAFKLGPSMHRDGPEYAAPSSDVIRVRRLDAPEPAPVPPLSPAPPPAQAENAVESAPRAKNEAAALSSPARARAETAAPPPPPAVAADEAAAPIEADKEDRVPAAGALRKSERFAPVAAPPATPQAFPDQSRKRAASELDAVERRQIMAKGAWQNLHDSDDARSGPSAAPREAGAAADTRAKASTDGGSAAKATRDAAPPPAPTLQAEMKAPPREAPLAAPAAAGSALGKVSQEPQAAAHGGAAPTAMPAAPASAAKPKRSSSDPNAALYPEHWLANIRTMLREHRRADALRSLDEFRRLYPDYRLPDDLRDLK
jgi:hypothetical protein